jgi:hypothetical protein
MNCEGNDRRRKTEVVSYVNTDNKSRVRVEAICRNRDPQGEWNLAGRRRKLAKGRKPGGKNENLDL